MALRKFRELAFLLIGLLAVYGAILYKSSIWKSKIKATLYPYDKQQTVSWLSWEAKGENPSFSSSYKQDPTFPFSSEDFKYFQQECFLDQFVALIEKESKNELEQAINYSLYWFSDAYNDRNHVMQFIKLWSCIECFFSIEPSGITEVNAEGIVKTLTHAGYQLIKPSEYKKIKARAKYLYKLRSKALHRAKHHDIKLEDLNDLSHWAAWIIVSMVALSQQNIQTLKQVKEYLKLDSMHTKI